MSIKTFRLPALALATVLFSIPASTAFAQYRQGQTPPNAPDVRTATPLSPESSARAKRFLAAVQSILKETSEQRSSASKLPSEKDYLIVAPPWAETKESRQEAIKELLNSALGVVTDAPIVDIQKRIAGRRDSINTLQQQIATLEEKKLTAPKDALLPGIWTDTVSSIDKNIEELKARIANNKDDIKKAKTDIQKSLADAGITIPPSQVNLMLDSVLGGDLIKIVAAFEAVKGIDTHLATLMKTNTANIKVQRQYFAMHAALFAMLVHTQGSLIEKIDQVYLKKLEGIQKDIRKTQKETKKLLRKNLREDQKRTLRSNLKQQKFAERVASYYRSYLMTQRKHLVDARNRTRRDLSIADNTYKTVEASFQLRGLIEDAKSSFEAIKRLEVPGFDLLFQNDTMRKEFEKLTDQLAPGS